MDHKDADALFVSCTALPILSILEKLEKKAFLIPTPGQTEQEYLANQLHKKKTVSYTHLTLPTSDLE